MTELIRDFPITTVLSVVTETPLTDNSLELHHFLEWWTDENLFPHQLVAASREAKSAILASYPHLAETISEAKSVDHSNWRDALAMWRERYGDVITVRRATGVRHRHVVSEVVAELAAFIKSLEAAVVTAGKDGSSERK